jgi:uncharacterized membrane protein
VMENEEVMTELQETAERTGSDRNLPKVTYLVHFRGKTWKVMKPVVHVTGPLES